MSTDLSQQKPRSSSLIVTLAMKAGIEPGKYIATIKATVIDPSATEEELIAFLLVAHHYDLDPLTKQIYAFPKKGGGIQPMVPVDGWAKIINDHPAFDGMDFTDNFAADGTLDSITCKMYRKDRTRHTQCTEYMDECKGTTEPWRRWPRRMLRHKAMIQAARYAFALSGIVDEDEADRINSVRHGDGPTITIQNSQPREQIALPQSAQGAVSTDDLAKPKGRKKKEQENVAETKTVDSETKSQTQGYMDVIANQGREDYPDGEPAADAPSVTSGAADVPNTGEDIDADYLELIEGRIKRAADVAALNAIEAKEIKPLTMSIPQRARLNSQVQAKRKELAG